MTQQQGTRTCGSNLLRTILAGVVLAGFLGSWSDCAWAVTNDWISGSAGWFTPANWSLGVLPSSTDDATITNNTTATIQGATVATANNLVVENGGVTVGSISAGELTVNGEI